MKITVALRVFASGGFQLDVGDTFGTNEAIITFNASRAHRALFVLFLD